MNKSFAAILILGAGATAFTTLRSTTGQAQAVIASQHVQWQAATNRLADLQAAAAGLRKEVFDKKLQLRQASLNPSHNPELLQLLGGDTSKGHAAAWAELRDRLGIDWNNSEDYVLVSKRVLKGLNFTRLTGGGWLSDQAGALLAISPDEEARIKQAIQHSTDEAWLQVRRTEPSGNILAQYTIPAPDPTFQQSVSNRFVAEITSNLGAERADLFLDQAWRELLRELAPSANGDVTMTIRRTLTDGEPKLICETREGDSVYSMDVQYAHYPSSWFLTLFPGGWETLAKREGFELPTSFLSK
ncbi:MAG: hypothetical protein JWR69_1773 [Pedosphaera sp.]|nr:hypothetical protein [Pedosphaera sp.]